MNDCSNGRLVSFLIEGDDMVSCEVCLEPFQTPNRPPKILPCGHNFCDQCLFSLCCHQQRYLNMRQRREMNVTVIHVPDKPTKWNLPSISSDSFECRPSETLKQKSQCDRCGDCSRKFLPKILGKVARFCQGCSIEGTITFYCLECCVNNHNGHVLLSLSELQTEQLKVLGELRELRRKLMESFQAPSTKSEDTKEIIIREDDDLSDGLSSLDNAIQRVESATIISPRKLTELRNEQIHKCSRLFSRKLIAQEKSRDKSVESKASTAFQRRSVSRSSDFANSGTLDFVLTFLPENQLGSELFTLIKTMSTTNTVEQRCDAYVKAAMIITNIIYDDIPLEQLSVFADALLQCFHQVHNLSKIRARISKTVSRKTIWKCVQMSYTEMLRLGAKNYLSYEPERIALLDDLAYLCYLFADVCDQATVTICMIEAARARVSIGALNEPVQQKTALRLKEIDEHLLECRRLQKLQDLRTTKTKRTVKLKHLWRFFFRRAKSPV